MSAIPDESIDALVTDPPAGISFMGKGWDSPNVVGSFRGRDNGPGTNPSGIQGEINKVGSVRARLGFQEMLAPIFAECLRVMKPGAHGFVWALPRTSHWTATALEDAGFEIRDIVTHLFGSGFPKSMDVAKAIDKHLGAQGTFGDPKTAAHAGWIERGRMRGADGNEGWQSPWMADEAAVDRNAQAYIPATDEARANQGWGTALKPASEHWILVRKPLSEKNVAANVLQHGTGALNIDASRIGTSDTFSGSGAKPLSYGGANHRPYHDSAPPDGGTQQHPDGRWPANVVLSHNDDCEQIGTRTVPGDARADLGWNGNPRANQFGDATGMFAADADAPAPRARGQRDPGFFDVGSENGDPAPAGPLYGDEQVPIYRCAADCPVGMLDAQTAKDGLDGASRFYFVAKPPGSEKNAGVDGGNSHPTIKSVALMQWLIRLVCPAGGIVLDPFAGSGSTLVAAESLGFRWVGFEREPEYHAIAMARLAQRSLFSS